MVTLTSFGFKYGAPDANIVWDVRFLPNPYFDLTLRHMTGLDSQIQSLYSSSLLRKVPYVPSK